MLGALDSWHKSYVGSADSSLLPCPDTAPRRRSMWSRLARVTAAAVLAVLPTLVPPTSTAAAASGSGVGSPAVFGPAAQGRSCPEPNDTFQAACYLGPELGRAGLHLDAERRRRVSDRGAGLQHRRPRRDADRCRRRTRSSWRTGTATSSPPRRRPARRPGDRHHGGHPRRLLHLRPLARAAASARTGRTRSSAR